MFTWHVEHAMVIRATTRSTCNPTMLRDKLKLELISATPRATLTHLSCSPNFPRASYLDERTLTHEPMSVLGKHVAGIFEYKARDSNAILSG